MTNYDHRPRLEILADHITAGGDSDEGRLFFIDDVWDNGFEGDPEVGARLEKLRFLAYDDDRELYYKGDAYFEPEESDEQLYDGLHQLESWAGVTILEFPDNPSMNIG